MYKSFSGGKMLFIIRNKTVQKESFENELIQKTCAIKIMKWSKGTYSNTVMLVCLCASHCGLEESI